MVHSKIKVPGLGVAEDSKSVCNLKVGYLGDQYILYKGGSIASASRHSAPHPVSGQERLTQNVVSHSQIKYALYPCLSSGTVSKLLAALICWKWQDMSVARTMSMTSARNSRYSSRDKFTRMLQSSSLINLMRHGTKGKRQNI